MFNIQRDFEIAVTIRVLKVRNTHTRSRQYEPEFLTSYSVNYCGNELISK